MTTKTIQSPCTLLSLDHNTYPFCYPSTLPPKSLDVCYGTRNPATVDCPWFSCKVWPHDPSVSWTEAEKNLILSDLVPLTQHLSQTQNLVSYHRHGHDEIWHVAYVPK